MWIRRTFRGLCNASLFVLLSWKVAANKMQGSVWKSVKLCKKRCQKWPWILFGATHRENKQWPGDSLRFHCCCSSSIDWSNTVYVFGQLAFEHSGQQILLRNNLSRWHTVGANKNGPFYITLHFSFELWLPVPLRLSPVFFDLRRSSGIWLKVPLSVTSWNFCQSRFKKTCLTRVLWTKGICLFSWSSCDPGMCDALFRATYREVFFNTTSISSPSELFSKVLQRAWINQEPLLMLLKA